MFRNSVKTPLFTVDERVEMLRRGHGKVPNVRVDKFDGLIVDFCTANDIAAIVKGLRAVSDFDYEMQMAQMNYNQAGVETLFVTTNPLYAFLSSSLVKEFAKFGGDVSGPGARGGPGPADRAAVPRSVLGRRAGRLQSHGRSWDCARPAGKLSRRYPAHYLLPAMPHSRTKHLKRLDPA